MGTNNPEKKPTNKIRIGTSGWTYNDWKGAFYPETLAKSRWLDYYATQFSTVEINATFYGTFKDTTYENWRGRVPEGFCYVLKAPRLITHRKLLLNVQENIETFWRSASILGDKLGLILLQVAPQTPYDPERVEKAIRAFGDPGRIAVEFRDEKWLTPEVEEMLRSLGAVYCNPDSPKSHLTDILTSSTGYIRLHGRTQWFAYNYTESDLEDVAPVARRMQARGAQTSSIFFNNDFHANAIRNAQRLKEILK